MEILDIVRQSCILEAIANHSSAKVTSAALTTRTAMPICISFIPTHQTVVFDKHFLKTNGRGKVKVNINKKKLDLTLKNISCIKEWINQFVGAATVSLLIPHINFTVTTLTLNYSVGPVLGGERQNPHFYPTRKLLQQYN